MYITVHIQCYAHDKKGLDDSEIKAVRSVGFTLDETLTESMIRWEDVVRKLAEGAGEKHEEKKRDVLLGVRDVTD